MFSDSALSLLLDTDEELLEWKTKFDERLARLESKISKLEREKDDTITKRFHLQEEIKDCIRDISKLQTEAEVISLTVMHKLILITFFKIPF